MEKALSFLVLALLLGGGYWVTQLNAGYVLQTKQMTEETRHNTEETRRLAESTRKNAEAVEEATSTIAQALDATTKMTVSNKELKAAIERTHREVVWRYESTKNDAANTRQARAEIAAEMQRLELAKAEFDKQLAAATKVAALAPALNAPRP